MGGIKINWSKILFRTLKAMVVLSTKQAQGFGVHLGLLLNGVHKLQLGKSTTIPFLRILTTKSVGTYLVSENSNRAEPIKEKKASGGRDKVGVTKAKRLEECALELMPSFNQKSSVNARKLLMTDSLHNSAWRTSLEDNMAKMFRWTEAECLREAFKQRLTVHAKFKELFIIKLLNSRRKNFFPSDAFTRVDMLIMEVLAEAHIISMVANLALSKQHKLVWTLPGPSNLFSGPDEDTTGCLVLSLQKPTVKQYTDLVIHLSAQFTEFIPDAVFKVISTGSMMIYFVDFLKKHQFREITISRALSSFKSNFNERMTYLELSVEDLCQSHMALVTKHWRHHLDMLRRGDKFKDDLSLETTANRMMLQKQSAEMSSSLTSLSSHLAEVVAHLKRVGDVKMGEVGSSSSRKGESSSGDRYRDRVESVDGFESVLKEDVLSKISVLVLRKCR
ncbi:hypothetical protein F511_19466 [Dorcoceras hygrometricum]|uniref:Uncharacterized protein n=1 Tax=Dorcoceras hygrometricum TaxID=472368 RepID=A0A2Z7DF75_9LAMI|nr:hypothetical protein F511_19466 [Dorcoceras hygrometricum]